MNMRYIRYKTQEMQYNLKNLGQEDKWVSACYTRPSTFINVCEGPECNCNKIGDIYYKWQPEGTLCADYNKYQREVEYKSTDYVNWLPTGRSRKGIELEHNSEGCGYINRNLLAFEFSGSAPQRYTINGVKRTANTSPVRIDIVEDLGITEFTSAKEFFLQDKTQYGVNSCTATKIISIPDTRNVTNMAGMFIGCTSLTELSVNSFNTSNVTDMTGMFGACMKLKKLDLSNFNVSKVTNFSRMFEDCWDLTEIDLSNWDLRHNLADTTDMFKECKKLCKIIMNNCDCATKQTIQNALIQSGAIATIESNSTCQTNLLEFEFSGTAYHTYTINSYIYTATTSPVKDEIYNFTSARDMFRQLRLEEPYDENNITKIISIPDTRNVTSMEGMFYECSHLTSLDLSSLNTSNVTSMEGMFFNCSQIRELDLSNFIMKEPISMFEMFKGCSNLTTLNLSDWKLTYAPKMFEGCTALKTIIMKNCDQVTIDKIKAALTASKIPEGQVTIIIN